jgi:membrane protein DedA with SNARE-associated domain
MSFEWFLEKYGYVAILVGTFLEGETILVLGGFAARRGYLDLAGVIAAAFAGSLIGDQVYFFLGRLQGTRIVARRPAWKPRVARAQLMLQRYQTALILGFRFVYGLRSVTPFALGMSGVSVTRFAILNVGSAAAWAIVLGLAGYAMGNAIETLLGDVKHYEAEVFLGIAAFGGLLWVIHLVRSR